ncbi:MAG: hypothetical protein HYW79_00400 [Parcubacteria group bacterium]|nr:hypothetical protein [Parcubacteria group bacterium]
MIRSPAAAESPSARALVVLLANKLPVPEAVVGHSSASLGVALAIASVTNVDLTESASPLEIQI